MDFELIERHPWITGATIVGGGLILFLLLRGRGSSAAAQSPSGVTYYPASSGTDPTAAALQSQEDQISAALAATNIQSQTQLGLAGISADVSKLNITAGQDVTNRQTAAQLALGLGTLQAQVDLAAIQAQSELDAINAIARAYGGGSAGSSGTGSGSGGGTTPTTVTTYTTQITPAVPVQISPNYSASPVAGATGIGTLDTGNYPIDPIGGPVLPGGRPLEPAAAYIPVGAWPDASIVAQNTLQSVEQENATLISNRNNNFNACMSDASLSAGAANYASLVQGCHAQYGV